mmetsp:Transcript_2738/g.4444  ORF Transcript_2738/g.4444 Transcript_2738/m.4444 type:complete len:89 (-) Transcript_2738:102-368(-)
MYGVLPRPHAFAWQSLRLELDESSAHLNCVAPGLYYVGSRLFLTPAKQPAVCFDEGPAGLKEAGEKLSTISPSMRTSPTDTATKECTD